MLNTTMTQDEIKAALFKMLPYKSQVVHGLHAGFFHSMWNTVGKNLCKFVENFFALGELPSGTNDTLLTLIPKVSQPESISHLRPIILCNVGYKVITKTMTNRLKQIMTTVIALNQSSFVSGRQITNNIIIFQEGLHSMRTRFPGEEFMTIKIRLKKGLRPPILAFHS